MVFSSGSETEFEELLSLADFESEATRRLDPPLATFVNGGDKDGITLKRNRASFDRLEFNAERLIDVTDRTISTTVLGTSIRLPVLVAPMGLHSLVHQSGEEATALGVHCAGSIMTTGTMASRSVEQVSATTDGPLWFQIYHTDRRSTEIAIRRAEMARCCAICITVDMPVVFRAREHDRRTGFQPTKDQLLANFDPSVARLPLGVNPCDVTIKGVPRPFTRADLEWLRALTDLPIVIKGILTATSARVCADLGADAVIVSNHGGRAMDCLPATIDVLPEVAGEVEDDCEVLLDGGVRRGSDVVKAISLGASAVLVGRPVFWGLTLGGALGVARVFEILDQEIHETLIGIGCPSIQDLGPTYVRAPTMSHN